MNRKHKQNKHRRKRTICRPITFDEVKVLTCGKIIYFFGDLMDGSGNIVGKSLMFYERDKPEEVAQKWSLQIYDDGNMMIAEW